MKGSIILGLINLAVVSTIAILTALILPLIWFTPLKDKVLLIVALIILKITTR